MIKSSLIEFRDIGRHMPRRRIERGYVYKIGKKAKMWEGRYHVYVTLPDGTEANVVVRSLKGWRPAA